MLEPLHILSALLILLNLALLVNHALIAYFSFVYTVCNASAASGLVSGP